MATPWMIYEMVNTFGLQLTMICHGMIFNQLNCCHRGHAINWIPNLRWDQRTCLHTQGIHNTHTTSIGVCLGCVGSLPISTDPMQSTVPRSN